MIMSNNPLHVPGNFLSRYLVDWLSESLPRSFKRLFYVGSALAIILRERKPDMRIIEKMNQALHLASSGEVILLPAYVGCLIWKSPGNAVIQLARGSVPVNAIDYKDLSDEDCWKVGIAFAKESSIWMRYASYQTMAADIVNMIKELKKAA